MNFQELALRIVIDWRAQQVMDPLVSVLAGVLKQNALSALQGARNDMEHILNNYIVYASEPYVPGAEMREAIRIVDQHVASIKNSF